MIPTPKIYMIDLIITDLQIIILRYWDQDGTKNLKISYNQVDLVILEKIEPSILNDLRYIGRLEKKRWNNRNKYVTVIKSLKIVGISE